MRKDFYWIGIILLVMWLVRIVDATIPYSFNGLGVTPRTLQGLTGIVLMPFLHGGFGHLLSNTLSLTILMALAVSSRPNPWPVIAITSLLGAALLWVVGRSDTHVGASGLIFGLIGLLLVDGFLQRKLVPVGVAIVVGILFGGTVLAGLMPSPGISWDGHLCGLVGGAAVAYVSGRRDGDW